MFFYSADAETAKSDFERLISIVRKNPFVCRAKVHLAKYGDDKFVTALIYPAEYDDQVSRWLLDVEYKTPGAAESGTSAVQRYYDTTPTFLKKEQLFGRPSVISRTGQDLFLYNGRRQPYRTRGLGYSRFRAGRRPAF